jgi:hypothetical protein
MPGPGPDWPLTGAADPGEQLPRPDEYDHNSKESAMHVLEVRNDELMDSITRQAAERSITYAAIVALIGAVDGFTVSTTRPVTPPHAPIPATPCQRR